MFKIGEFAQIARVTSRLLRYYDHIGLLAPMHTDATTGYRSYSADQLPRLNRILALQGLGFALDEVARIIDDDVSPEELRGMLTMRKSQIEQALIAEQTKLRQIEARILQIEEQGGMRDYDVAIKRIEATPFLSLRRQFDEMTEIGALMRRIDRAMRKQLSADAWLDLAIVVHSDFEDEGFDVEPGILLGRRENETLELDDGSMLSLRELEPVETMASIVRSGPIHESHLAYGAVGVWMEASNFEICGLCREIIIEPPFRNPANDDAVLEIQFPVRKRGAG